jgi:iron complex outermembrane receptor protein
MRRSRLPVRRLSPLRTTMPRATIVVTGTLIKGLARGRAAPVEVIDAEELAAQGSPTMLELTKRLAVSAGVIGDASQFDTRSQFNEGTASVNLRGLGPQRTLVLLNGKRMVATGSGNLPLVDVNLFPTGAISRIEVLKDGAATTYGSDAIAGVVNFITRTDQDGFLAAGDYRYVDGSEGDWNGALSWGGEVGPARLFVSGGYQHRGELTTLDRGFSYLTYPENPQGGWTGGGSPGNFDYNATVGGVRFDADDGCEGVGGFRSRPGSTADLCQVQYLGFTNLVEPEDRFQLFADADIDLADALELRLTGLYGRTETVLTTSPSYLPTIAPSANAAFGGQGLFVIPQYARADRLLRAVRRRGGCADRRERGAAGAGAGVPGALPAGARRGQPAVRQRPADRGAAAQLGHVPVHRRARLAARRGARPHRRGDLLRIRPLLRGRRQLRRPAAERARRFGGESCATPRRNRARG